MPGDILKITGQLRDPLAIVVLVAAFYFTHIGSNMIRPEAIDLEKKTGFGLIVFSVILVAGYFVWHVTKLSPRPQSERENTFVEDVKREGQAHIRQGGKVFM